MGHGVIPASPNATVSWYLYDLAWVLARLDRATDLSPLTGSVPLRESRCMQMSSLASRKKTLRKRRSR